MEIDGPSGDPYPEHDDMGLLHPEIDPDDMIDAYTGTGTVPLGAYDGREQALIIADDELGDLLVRSNELLGEDQLDAVLTANEPFNDTSYETAPDGTQVADEYFSYRLLLRKLPALIKSGEAASITQEGTITLLTGALGAVRNPDNQYSDLIAGGFTKILAKSGENGQQLTPEDVEALSATFKRAAEDSREIYALSIIRSAQGAGMDVQQSCAVITDYLDTSNPRQSAHYVRHLSEALEVLNVADADPALVTEVFGYMNANDAEARKNTFTGFKMIVGRIAPQLGHTTNETLRAINEKVREGMSVDEALISFAPLAEDNIDTSKVADVDPRVYFTPTKGELVHSYMPYRAVRPLNDGMRDIEKLTDASMRDSDTVAEGMWIFSPDTNVWYSLGGETVTTIGGVRHESAAYDMGKLGDNVAHVHIHPKEYSRESSLFSEIFPSAADITAIAEMREDASQPVQVQSLISHRFGITRFTYPNNNTAIRDMGGTFSAMRDAMYGESFQTPDELLNYAHEVGSEAFAREAIAAMNNRLPEDFSITLYPRGTDFETIIGGNNEPGQPTLPELPDNPPA